MNTTIMNNNISFEEGMNIHCKTSAEAEILLDLLKDAGYTWNSWDPIHPEYNRWEVYKETTVYRLGLGHRITIWDTADAKQNCWKVTELNEITGTKTEDKKPIELVVSIPAYFFDEKTMRNLKNLLSSKKHLIQRALSVSEFPIEVGEKTVTFRWATTDMYTEKEKEAGCNFIIGLCEMAKRCKCISPKETVAETPRRNFLMFLGRVGFSGEKNMEARRILTRNLPISSNVVRTSEGTFLVDNLLNVDRVAVDNASGKLCYV